MQEQILITIPLGNVYVHLNEKTPDEHYQIVGSLKEKESFDVFLDLPIDKGRSLTVFLAFCADKIIQAIAYRDQNLTFPSDLHLFGDEPYSTEELELFYDAANFIEEYKTQRAK